MLAQILNTSGLGLLLLLIIFFLSFSYVLLQRILVDCNILYSHFDTPYMMYASCRYIWFLFCSNSI